jgi:hypothetical protein
MTKTDTVEKLKWPDYAVIMMDGRVYCAMLASKGTRRIDSSSLYDEVSNARGRDVIGALMHGKGFIENLLKAPNEYLCLEATSQFLKTHDPKLDCSKCKNYQNFQKKFNENVEREHHGSGAEV